MTMDKKNIRKICNISIIFLAVIAGVIIYLHEQGKVFYEQNLGLIEVMCLTGTIILIYFSAYICTDNIITSLIATVLVMPVVYMSLKKLTFYLTVDEIKAINEQLYITDADAFTKAANHWKSGDSRTNYVVLGTLVKLAPLEWFRIHGVSPEQVTKALHWCMGMLTVDIIVAVTYWQSFRQHHNDSIGKKIVQNNSDVREEDKYTVIRYVANQIITAAVIAALFYGIMGIQVTLLSIKTVNYDLNSLLLALLSVMLMIYAVRKVNTLNALMAVVTAMLATQDKMLAGPMLYLALLILTIIITIRITKTGKKVSPVLIAAAVTMIPVIMSYMANYYVGIFLADGNIPSVTFYDTVYSYVQYSLTILESVSSFFALSDRAVIVNLLMLWIIFSIAGYITKKNIIDSDNRVKRLKLWKKQEKTVEMVIILLVFVMFVIAIVSIHTTPFVYMSPLRMPDDGCYNSKSIMNGITYHFNARSMAEHYIKLAGTIIYIFYKSIPVGYMLLFATIGIFAYIHKKTPDITSMLFIVLSAVIFPLLYSAIQITPNERYQNVYILIFAYLTVVTVLEISRDIILELPYEKNAKTIPAFSLICGILVITILNAADVHRFDYAYTEYFALWDTEYIKQEEECYTGKMIPGYHGAWGEHVIYAGEMLGKYAHDNNIPYSDMTIHYEYYGEYYNNGGMNIIVDGSEAWENCEIGEHDYFVVSRGAATKEAAGGLSIKLIENATPMYRFGYNGATEMWVYSGDEVEKWR